MKIKYLEIKNFKQFKDLTLKLTYPQGHPKEGQPLDKICIIGQSGTGKTNLLEVIRDKQNNDEVQTSFFEEENSKTEEIYFVSTNRETIKSNIDNDVTEDTHNNMSDLDMNLLRQLENAKNNVVKDSLNESKSILGSAFMIQKSIVQKSVEIEKNIAEIKGKYTLIKNNNLIRLKTSYINIDDSAWFLLEEKIANYAQERLKYMDRLSNKLLNLDDYTKDEFKREIQEWEAQNENIVENIANKLNTILRFFNLELTKIDENQQSYNALTIKDLSNDTIIDYDNLSTGTKNLIATFIPLKIHNPKDSIILIDEPENSFYPDIQRQLTEFYMEVGENNQLIVATHSPLIASSFEPWEVVELKFDKNNQVYREKYFEGDIDHIDNYTLDPRMLTWTGILTDIFDLKEDSNFSFREKKLMEYIRLEKELKSIEDKKLKKEKFEALMKLSNLLGLTGNEKD
ncbi:MAG: AAA family ATPase [Sulfuricurvum sp.]